MYMSLISTCICKLDKIVDGCVNGMKMRFFRYVIDTRSAIWTERMCVRISTTAE